MTITFWLTVTDTSPHFTMVLADALDGLIRPGLPVSIPDAVYLEATRVRGARAIARAHGDAVVQLVQRPVDTVLRYLQNRPQRA